MITLYIQCNCLQELWSSDMMKLIAQATQKLSLGAAATFSKKGGSKHSIETICILLEINNPNGGGEVPGNPPPPPPPPPPRSAPGNLMNIKLKFLVMDFWPSWRKKEKHYCNWSLHGILLACRLHFVQWTEMKEDSSCPPSHCSRDECINNYRP